MRCNAMPAKKSSLPVAWLRRAGIALAAALLGLAARVPAHAADEAPGDDTANCIAVMQTQADGLARQVKAGDQAREPALQTELRRAAALIGRTYLDGLHDAAAAKARLKAAQEGQATWSQERKSRVHQACLKRADAELAAASAPQRFIVDRFAQAHLRRMLSQP
jgi:hypothetical protein